MMYSEFIERTGFNESYMTYNDYTDFVEPVYNDSTDDKDKFCKKFYKLHRERVSNAVELMISGKALAEKEAYICGDQSMFSEIEKAHEMLKKGFLKQLKKLYK